MADLSNGSNVFQTYNNAGTGVAELGDNKKVDTGNSIAGRTIIAKVAKSNITQAELNTMRLALQTGGTYSGVTNDAMTIVGITSDGGDTPGAGNVDFISGESDVVFFALQGTGDITADASNALGVTGAALTVEAVFVEGTIHPTRFVKTAADTGITVAAEQSGNF